MFRPFLRVRAAKTYANSRFNKRKWDPRIVGPFWDVHYGLAIARYPIDFAMGYFSKDNFGVVTAAGYDPGHSTRPDLQVIDRNSQSA